MQPNDDMSNADATRVSKSDAFFISARDALDPSTFALQLSPRAELYIGVLMNAVTAIPHFVSLKGIYFE